MSKTATAWMTVLFITLVCAIAPPVANAQKTCAYLNKCCTHECIEWYQPPHQHDCKKTKCVACFEYRDCPKVAAIQSESTENALLVLEPSNRTLSGKLRSVVAVGGESTGWELILDSATTCSGVRLEKLDVDPHGHELKDMDGKRVRIEGQVTWQVTVERHVHAVLVVEKVETVAIRLRSPEWAVVVWFTNSIAEDIEQSYLTMSSS